MTQTDTSERSESSVETARAAAASARAYASKGAPYLRRGVESGGVVAVVGGVGLLSGLRAIRGGKRTRGLARLVAGVAFLTVAAAQRRPRGAGRASDAEAPGVAGTVADVETIADEAGGVGETDHAAGEAASAVVDTGPDIEDAGSGLESESDAASAGIDQREVSDIGVDSQDLAAATERETGATGAAIGSEDVDRLGEAAFDGQSQEVPAPQRAFNQGMLAHSTEVFWGVRARDDAVLVSQDYDAVEGRDGVQYVASSTIGDDARELPIPSTVLDHWDEVFGGGTAVVAGDGILFVTTDDLAADGLLFVLPVAWADDGFGDTA